MVNSEDGSTADTPLIVEDQAAQDEKQKKKRDKIRSAWISFVGRIVAQILGAVATITLALALADRIRSEPMTAAGAATPHQQLAMRPAVPRDSRISIAVLPLELFSPDPTQQYLADSLTEEIVEALTNVPALRVISRTSTLQYRQQPRSVPDIAAALDVDVVIEGCVLHEGDTIRIRLRAIDGQRDTHLGTVVRSSRILDLLTLRADMASSAARELADVVRGDAVRAR
jgi:TolB-like protein